MSTPNWAPLKRNYESEKKAHACKLSSASNHPLMVARAVEVSIKQIDSNNRRSSIKSSKPLAQSANSSDDPLGDPLSGMLSSDADLDPLTAMMQSESAPSKAQTTTVVQAAAEASEDKKENALNFAALRKELIKDFAFNGMIVFDRNAMDTISGSGVEDGSRTKKVAGTDKYSRRLAVLESQTQSSGPVSTVSYSLEQFVTHISSLTADLNTAWASDERVQSLKIAIQIAKILGDTTGPQFYPYVFALVVDVLDKFGDMVYNRLRQRADESLNDGNPKGTKRMPDNFTEKDVPQLSKDTCRNWFFKAACIRELIPRLYIEMALCRSYRFIVPESEFPAIISRMANIIRGIGDPLVCAYARVFLLKVGTAVAPNFTSFHLGLTQDLMTTHKMVIDPALNSFTLNKGGMTHYVTLKDFTRSLSPAIGWVIRHCGKTASKEIFQQVLFLFKEQCKDAMVLKHIIDSFDSTFYCEKATGMSTLIKSVIPSCYTVADVYASFGQQLLVNPPPQELRLALLNDVWKTVSKVDDLGSYVNSAYCWLETIGAHYSEKEALVLLTDISSRVQQVISNNETVSDLVFRQLEVIVNIFIRSPTMCDVVLTSEHLMKLLDVFKGPKKIEICKDIMDSFRKHPPTNDAILINSLFYIGRVMHDSIDSLSPEGEKKYIASLLGAFIDKIDFGKEMENQLNMYVECRAIFCNLDQIKDKLVMCVSLLASKIHRFVKGKHSKKTSGFVKACLAYCHITIPSISDGFRKLQLLIHCAQVAITNQCLPQTDTLLKAAISIIPELPAYEEIEGKRVHSEEKVASNIRYLLSTLVLTPGHPEHGPFYIVKGLFNALPKFQWQANSACQARLYCDIIALMCTYAQRRFPYKIQNVESNDDLYCGNSEYIVDLTDTLNTDITEVLKALSSLKDATDSSARASQAKIILDLVNQICERMELTDDVFNFVGNLLALGLTNRDVLSKPDRSYWSRTIEFVRFKIQNSNNVNQRLLQSISSMA